ncbi:unnamed protein product, partial [Heterosigma akashiwo]
MLPDSKKRLKRPGVAKRFVFEKDDKIIEYKGDVLTLDQVKKRYGENQGPYIWNNEKGGYIDAACDRSAGSFVRTSDKSNATFESIDGKIWFIATQDIKEGEEII